MTKVFVPIFEKDGEEFFFLHDDWKTDNLAGANEIGLGSMFVECILWKMEFTEAREIQ